MDLVNQKERVSLPLKTIMKLVKSRASSDKEWARDAAGRFTSGAFKASQTGAKQRADEKGRMSDMGQMAKSLTAGTKESEEYIRSGKYRKGGK